MDGGVNGKLGVAPCQSRRATVRPSVSEQDLFPMPGEGLNDPDRAFDVIYVQRPPKAGEEWWKRHVPVIRLRPRRNIDLIHGLVEMAREQHDWRWVMALTAKGEPWLRDDLRVLGSRDELRFFARVRLEARRKLVGAADQQT